MSNSHTTLLASTSSLKNKHIFWIFKAGFWISLKYWLESGPPNFQRFHRPNESSTFRQIFWKLCICDLISGKLSKIHLLQAQSRIEIFFGIFTIKSKWLESGPVILGQNTRMRASKREKVVIWEGKKPSGGSKAGQLGWLAFEPGSLLSLARFRASTLL